MTDAEKAYQYFVIAVPENEEQAKAYFWARKALQPTLTPPNEPLTLEELREMKGQPVWTVTTGLDGSGRWELVCDVDYEDVLEMASCVDGFYAIEMDTYRSTWTAYRRPLERMKKIMRENGIMVIPSEYPGSTEKWNIQKPRDKKEEL
jgi:hypothetical protein